MPHPKAGYMDALFFLSRANFFLAMRGEPYMTLDPSPECSCSAQASAMYRVEVLEIGRHGGLSSNPWAMRDKPRFNDIENHHSF